MSNVAVKFVTGDYSHYDNSEYVQGTIYFLEDNSGVVPVNRIFLNGEEYSVVKASQVLLNNTITVSHDVGGYSKTAQIPAGTNLLAIITTMLTGTISSQIYDVESRRVINVIDPVDPQDASTKHYSDSCALVWEGIGGE